MSKVCIFAALAVPIAIAGCAPGMSNRSLGARERPPPQVVESKPPPEVVEVKPEPQEVRAGDIKNLESEIAQLRDELEVNRARADSEAARAATAARESQAAIDALQAEIAEVTARADAKDRGENEAMRALRMELSDVTVRVDNAVAQSNKAVEIATEFLSNLVAAREEQKALIERNLRTFDAMDTRLSAIEGRVAQSREQSEAGLAAVVVSSSAMQQSLQATDQELAQLREQMIQLDKANVETRAAIDSSPMLRMLRDLESTQRDMAALRGELEKVQRDQEVARKRLQNYYLDLDTRISALQERERAARKAGANSIGEGDAAVTEPPPVTVDQSEPLPPLQIVPLNEKPESAGAAIGPAKARSLQNAPGAEISSPDGAADSIDSADLPSPESSSVPDVPDSTVAPGPGGTEDVPEALDPRPDTAHGSITTDWQIDTQRPATGVPRDPAE